jgi:hypothetical protein
MANSSIRFHASVKQFIHEEHQGARREEEINSQIAPIFADVENPRTPARSAARPEGRV